ncbi:hypothetical protein M758_6G183300 [Ceratodon purpureus]|uniref:Uncharacterized protein n=1 Tax=Ceratodon purpureus TaxID=3225 RepID=A0A8T0HJ68_CERPU|nr:hypothetical protein KC19_6G190700 [Ceratodon purpureus]KAG0614516.1 hypothetical protein M758_6G183300 [Ceratodon purpureus]
MASCHHSARIAFLFFLLLAIPEMQECSRPFAPDQADTVLVHNDNWISNLVEAVDDGTAEHGSGATPIHNPMVRDIRGSRLLLFVKSPPLPPPSNPCCTGGN